jgi:hypothetical protein
LRTQLKKKRSRLSCILCPNHMEIQGGTPMTMVARLQLPNTCCHVYSMTFCRPPAKNGIPRNNAAVFTRPFTISPDNIIYCCMMLDDTQETGCVSLIVHSSMLPIFLVNDGKGGTRFGILINIVLNGLGWTFQWRQKQLAYPSSPRNRG